MPVVVADEDQEASEVFRWRRGELIRLGFNRRQANRLAVVLDVCHDAEKLLNAGCPHDLVFDLLSL